MKINYNFSFLFVGFKMIGANEIALLIQEGRLSRIKSLMEPYTLEERQQIIARKIQNFSLLYMAVVKNEITAVKYLLDECGASVEDDEPYLVVAVNNKCYEIVKLLLNKGVDINSGGFMQGPPLYFASSYGDLSMVKYLVDNGADVNIIDAEGNTPLMESVKYPDICRYLLENGAHRDSINNRGKTAVMLAVDEEISHESLNVLHSFGADMGFTNEFGEDAVFVATQRGFLHIVKRLESFAVDVKPGLAKSHQLDSCYAYQEKEDAEAENYWRMSLNVLDLPITSRAYEIDDTRFISSFEHILDHLNWRSRVVIRYLETRFGSKNPYTMTAIALAAYYAENVIDSVKVFDLFIEELKSCPKNIYFLFMHCVDNICTKIVGDLKNQNMEDGVHLPQRMLGSFVNHMQEFSSRYNRLSLMEKLTKWPAVDFCFTDILKLIETILDLRPKELTALEDAVKKIVRKNLQGTENDSILHFCIKKGYRVSIIELLLSCGADMDSRNIRCRTPLHCIYVRPNNDKTEVIEMFLTYGFNFKKYKDGDFCLACTFNKRRLLRYPVKNTTLQCLAARAIHLNKCRILHVPRPFFNIVDSHSF